MFEMLAREYLTSQTGARRSPSLLQGAPGLCSALDKRFGDDVGQIASSLTTRITNSSPSSVDSSSVESRVAKSDVI